MALINWDDSFSVNVAEIDQQHQTLVSMINDLNDAMRQGKGKDVLGTTVGGLISYAATHFKTEETYFDQFGYPEADSHKKEHTDFVKKVTEIQGEFAERKLGLPIEVMNFLCDWFANHIKTTDMRYSQFFNEKGLR